MVDIAEALVDSVVEMPELIADVATNDPVAGIMLAIGVFLIVATLGVLGLLATGMAAELLSPGTTGRQHPRAR